MIRKMKPEGYERHTERSRSRRQTLERRRRRELKGAGRVVTAPS